MLAMQSTPQLNQRAEVIMGLINAKLMDRSYIAEEFKLFMQISTFDEFVPTEDVFTQFLYYLESRMVNYDLNHKSAVF